jgi:tRNA A37 threonylcarbamoyladenosine synthetase subunit TsaC/SUA5/YrdC
MSEVLVYLVQTDTTVGFSSKESEKLDRIKGRPSGKPYLRTLASFRELRNSCRVPKRHRKMVRRVKKTTFVYPDGIAKRVVKDGEYAEFLRHFGWMNSTSANRSGHGFESEWAEATCDVIVFRPSGFIQKAPSSIFKISKDKVTQLR